MFSRLVPVVVAWLATSAFAYAPIQWAKSPWNGFIITPKRFSGPFSGVSSQQLTLRTQIRNIEPGSLPHFAVKPDQSIAFGDLGCLEASGTSNGDSIRLNRCTGGPFQKWVWVPGEERRMMIELQDTRKCLQAVDDASASTEAPIQLRDCELGVSDSWRFEEPLLLATRGRNIAVASSFRYALSSLLLLVVLTAFGFTCGLMHWSGRRRAIATDSMVSNDGGGGLSLSVPLAQMACREAQIRSCQRSGRIFMGLNRVDTPAKYPGIKSYKMNTAAEDFVADAALPPTEKGTHASVEAEQAAALSGERSNSAVDETSEDRSTAVEDVDELDGTRWNRPADVATLMTLLSEEDAFLRETADHSTGLTISWPYISFSSGNLLERLELEGNKAQTKEKLLEIKRIADASKEQMLPAELTRMADAYSAIRRDLEYEILMGRERPANNTIVSDATLLQVSDDEVFLREAADHVGKPASMVTLCWSYIVYSVENLVKKLELGDYSARNAKAADKLLAIKQAAVASMREMSPAELKSVAARYKEILNTLDDQIHAVPHRIRASPILMSNEARSFHTVRRVGGVIPSLRSRLLSLRSKPPSLQSEDAPAFAVTKDAPEDKLFGLDLKAFAGTALAVLLFFSLGRGILAPTPGTFSVSYSSYSSTVVRTVDASGTPRVEETKSESSFSYGTPDQADKLAADKDAARNGAVVNPLVKFDGACRQDESSQLFCAPEL